MRRDSSLDFRIGSTISSRPDTQFALRHYLNVLRRSAWLIVLVPAATLLAAAAVTLTEPSIYRASTKLVVSQAGGEAAPEFGSAELMQTMSNLLESDIVVDPVIKDGQLGMSTDAFFRRLRTSYRPGSSVLEVSFDWPEKKEAAPILSGVATEFQRLVDAKFGVHASGLPGGNRQGLVAVSVFDPPHVEPNRVSPNPGRSLAFAGALSLVLALVLAFLRENLDERIRSRTDAEEWFEAPVIGSLPRGVVRAGRSSLAREGAAGRALAEALQVLRANLLLSQFGVGGPTVLVTSAHPREGKSTVAASLAIALASAGDDVICVDADLRRPSLHQYLDADGQAPGLFDVLAGGLAAEEALQRVELPFETAERVESVGRVTRAGKKSTGASLAATDGNGRLRLLTSGRREDDRAVHPERGTILTGERVRGLIEELRASADFVIFDGPPLLVADAFPLAVQSDSVLLVARQGRTTRERANAARATLAGLGVERVAVVLTEAAPLTGYGYH